MFKLDSLLGRRFFYADKETGVGWESKIDEVQRNFMSNSYTLELSCGTIVKIDHSFLYKQRNNPYFTNLKE